MADQPLTPEIFEFWLKKDPGCPIKSGADGNLLIFLANDYGLEIRLGGGIAVKGPDDYVFDEVTLDCAQTIASLCEIKANDLDKRRRGLRERAWNPVIAATYRHVAELVRATMTVQR